MEKEIPESMTTVNIKPDYAPSESYSSEPPPAYQRPKSPAVQVTKIIAVTVVLVTFVLGGFILASAYITANASCRHLEQELALLTETVDRFQGPVAPLQPEALVQDEVVVKSKHDALAAESKSIRKDDNNLSDESASSSSSESDEGDDDDSEDSDEDRIPIHIKLPLQLDFDDLAGALIDKNQRSRMNCIVEKKRAEEVVDHQPKTVNLPFGVNITTDPRYERISGERMAIFCESGNMQRNTESQQPSQQEDTVMIQPIMIPIPPSHFATHMNQEQEPQQSRGPMPPQMYQQLPLHPMEQMRPPMPNPMMMGQHQQQQQQQQQQPMGAQQSQMPPSAVLHHIAQQIIAQQLEAKHRAAMAAASEEGQSNELGGNGIGMMKSTPLQRVQEVQRMSRIPIPEEILNEINRMPNREVIVAVSHHQPPPQEQDEQQQERRQEIRIMQQARDSAQGMNGRQVYARGLPVNIPVPMMQQEAEQAAAASEEEKRPHFVHPRSVRSVDNVLLKSAKRVKRCACDCAC